MEIGKRIKELRIARGLTQEELADRSELSKGFISQLEHDQTSPSIATLDDILICLGSSLSEFFSPEPESEIVFHSEDFFEKIDPELRNRIEWIVPTAQKNLMEPVRLTLEAGGSTYQDLPHEGEEFGYVLRGRVTVHVGSRHVEAKKGEAFYYTPDKRHYITSKKGAQLIWVSVPPSF
ncbi:MAG: helix-turn-helix domain-containing protein [Anaerovoracaceae bacterium]|jgi:transcriptional regulator with XRE-family HTH domain